MSDWLINELRRIANCKNIKAYFSKNGKTGKNHNCWIINNGDDEVSLWLFKKEEHLSALSNGKNVLHEYSEINNKNRNGVDEKKFREYLKARLRDKKIL